MGSAEGSTVHVWTSTGQLFARFGPDDNGDERLVADVVDDGWVWAARQPLADVPPEHTDRRSAWLMQTTSAGSR